MGVKLAAASGGSVELVPTNTASNYTVTFPASTGTVVTTTSPKAGNVIQVVQTTTTTQIINSSSSWVSTGLSLSITPSSTSSKILALLNIPVTFGDNNGNAYIGVRLTRAGTQVSQTVVGNNVSGIVQQFCPVTLSYLDSPSTTSSTTYQVDFSEIQMANRYGSTAVCNSSYGTPTGTLQLLEIAG